MTTTNKPVRQCYSNDEENYNYDDFGDFIDSNEFEVGSTYWQADAIEINHADNIHISSILENMDECLYEEVGEVADADYSSVSDAAADELKALIAAWADKHVNLRYWKVRNVREMKITAEDLA